MYKLDVEYVNLENRFMAAIYCSECDKNATKEIFRHAIPTSGETGIIGQTQYVSLDHCMTEPRMTLEEVEKDVAEITNSLKAGFTEKRSKVVKTEEYKF